MQDNNFNRRHFFVDTCMLTHIGYKLCCRTANKLVTNIHVTSISRHNWRFCAHYFNAFLDFTLPVINNEKNMRNVQSLNQNFWWWPPFYYTALLFCCSGSNWNKTTLCSGLELHHNGYIYSLFLVRSRRDINIDACVNITSVARHYWRTVLSYTPVVDQLHTKHGSGSKPSIAHESTYFTEKQGGHISE